MERRSYQEVGRQECLLMLSRGRFSITPLRLLSLALALLFASAMGLAQNGCGGHAQGFWEREGGLGGAGSESFGCPADCRGEPCGFWLMTNVLELFSGRGPVQIHAQADGWVYVTVESSRTLARVRECGPNPDVQVFARTETAFEDVFARPGFVYTALPGGRVLQIQLFPLETTLLGQFETERAPKLVAGGTDWLLATNGSEGFAWIPIDEGSEGSATNFGKGSYQDTPALLFVDDSVIAQRTSEAGKAQIVRISSPHSEPRVLVEAPSADDLELQDASSEGVLYRTPDPEDPEAQLLSSISLQGGASIPLVSGNLVGRARWSRGAVIYFSEEQGLQDSEPRVQLREAVRYLGAYVIEAESGDLLLEDATSIYAEGRRLFATDADGNLYRRLILPNSL